VSDFLKDLRGKRVTLTLNAAAPVSIKGKLVSFDDHGIVLEEVSQGRMLVPWHAILHVVEIA
jgi:small nuclear ribonucleoprotein (snRNP)-like protein